MRINITKEIDMRQSVKEIEHSLNETYEQIEQQKGKVIEKDVIPLNNGKCIVLIDWEK